MKVLKKINNNVALCQDSQGNELVAFGNGIGFRKTPYELNDLSKISQTFYGVSAQNVAIINEIPSVYFSVAGKIVDEAQRTLPNQFSGNLVFGLADHIHFAVKRKREHMQIPQPITYDVKYLYKAEYTVGLHALQLIKKELNVELPSAEAASIALHFIDSESPYRNTSAANQQTIISESADIIDDMYKIKVDRNGPNYSRFATHMAYLLSRGANDDKGLQVDKTMFKSAKTQYPTAFQCVVKIERLFETKLDWQLSQAEQFYIMLHVVRMCSREDCNR